MTEKLLVHPVPSQCFIHIHVNEQLVSTLVCKPFFYSKCFNHEAGKSDVSTKSTVVPSLKMTCFILCNRNLGKLMWADLDQIDVSLTSHASGSPPILLNSMQTLFAIAIFQWPFFIGLGPINWRSLWACGVLSLTTHRDTMFRPPPRLLT